MAVGALRNFWVGAVEGEVLTMRPSMGRGGEEILTVIMCIKYRLCLSLGLRHAVWPQYPQDNALPECEGRYRGRRS